MSGYLLYMKELLATAGAKGEKAEVFVVREGVKEIHAELREVLEFGCVLVEHTDNPRRPERFTFIEYRDIRGVTHF